MEVLSENMTVMVNVRNFRTLFSFCSQINAVVKAGIHKILVRIAVKTLIRLLLQKQSDLALDCLSRP